MVVSRLFWDLFLLVPQSATKKYHQEKKNKIVKSFKGRLQQKKHITQFVWSEGPRKTTKPSAVSPRLLPDPPCFTSLVPLKTLKDILTLLKTSKAFKGPLNQGILQAFFDEMLSTSLCQDFGELIFELFFYACFFLPPKSQ